MGANALTQLVTGLNADLLDGQEGSYYQDAANITTGVLNNNRLSGDMVNRTLTNIFTVQQYMNPSTATPPFLLGVNAQNQKVVGLDADRLDGQEGSYYQSSTNQNAGTLPDARLSNNVGQIGVSKTWTQPQYFSAGAGIASNDLFWSKLADPRYFCSLRHSLSQSVTNDAAWHSLLLDTVIYDPDGMKDAGNGGIVIPKTGNYLVSFGVTFSSSATGSFRGAAVYLNGAQSRLRSVMEFSTTGTPMLNGALSMRLTVGELVELWAIHNASVNLDATTITLAVQWVGP